MEQLFCPKCGKRYPSGIASCAKDGESLLPLGKDDDLSGTVILDKYVLVQRLGKGAFGAVYRAYHRLAKTDVAVKILHSELVKQDTKTSRMAKDTFLREARTAMSMQSRHVVIVHDVDEDPVVGPFVVMEFVQGVTLDKYVKMVAPDRKRLPYKEIIDIALQVCEALEEAHDRGIVHRDLKPSNIMIMKGKDGGVFAKVLDFGIAKVAHKEGTDLTTLMSLQGIVGTPAYMSPEQCTGQPVDARSDIYTLGVILYELCTGVLPFHGSSPLAYIVAHATQNPRALTEVLDKREVPKELEQLIASMLKKKPEDRPQTIREVKEALGRIQTRLAKPKHKMKYVWGGLVVLLTAGLLSGLLVMTSEREDTGVFKQVSPTHSDSVAPPQPTVEPVKLLPEKSTPQVTGVDSGPKGLVTEPTEVTAIPAKQELLQAFEASKVEEHQEKAELTSPVKDTKRKDVTGKKPKKLQKILSDPSQTHLEKGVKTEGKGTKTEGQNIWEKFLGD